jgi:hypothetical protein
VVAAGVFSQAGISSTCICFVQWPGVAWAVRHFPVAAGLPPMVSKWMAPACGAGMCITLASLKLARGNAVSPLLLLLLPLSSAEWTSCQGQACFTRCH